MVRIVTDSSVLMTIEEGKELGFEVMPLCINIGDLEDRDMEVDMDEFYGDIVEYDVPQELFDYINIGQRGTLATVDGEFFDFGDGEEISL